MLQLKKMALVMFGLCASLAVSANAAPDLSTPKSAALAFANAVVAADGPGVRATASGTDEQFKLVDTIGTLVGSMKKLSDAATAKFGADNAISKSTKDMDLAAEVEGSEVKVEGDNATLIDPKKKDDAHPMKLIKKEGKWLVDLNSLPKEGLDEMVKMAPIMAKAATATVAEIKADKFKTAEEAQQGFGMKIAAEMLAAPPAPGAPPAPPAPEK